MPVGPAGPDELERLAGRIDRWAAAELTGNPIVAAVDRDPDPDLRRWFVRLKGEEKATMTVWLTLRERALHHESYFMPAPEEDVQAVWEYLLRLNGRMIGLRFAVGVEDAVYLLGEVPVARVDEDELDRIVGSTYAYTEQWFRPAMRIGYGARFVG